MSVDALSDVLKTVRLTGAVFYDCAAASPWVVESPEPKTILPRVLPGADHLIAYHAIVRGQAFASVSGGEPIPLEAGDVIVITKCDPHIVSSKPGLRADPGAMDRFGLTAGVPMPLILNCGADGPVSTNFVCGYLACDAFPFNPLVENLAPVITARAGGHASDGWLQEFMRFVLMESAARRAGSESILARMSELMFIEVLRRHIETLPAEQTGWLAGLRDPFVGKALSLMHGQPARTWTIEELAREVGQSRSVLAERFSGLVGMPPMHYLAKWRMQIASGLLATGGADMAAIAEETGYASEAAFSRAFKKIVGMPPSAWRQRFGAPRRAA